MTTLAYAMLLILLFRPDFRALGVFSIVAFALFFGSSAQAGYGVWDAAIHSTTQAVVFAGIGFVIVCLREFVGPRPKSNSDQPTDQSK